jgi:Dolichyl-phosphate-mannose-protein mannosyltransferase
MRLTTAGSGRVAAGPGIGVAGESPARLAVLDSPPDPITRDRPANEASDRAASGLAASDRAASDHAASDHAASNRAASDRATTRGNRWRRYLVVRSPLAVVLGAQAALSLRLVWSNTAFQDEGLYLRAGHLEWAGWLHGAAVPDFPSYFSGAPVAYPPIGALADIAGGLAAARILSLCFMLGVTALLWSTTARLYGQRAALLAAGLFATLAGAQFLGAFATYDSMSLLLLAVAVWLGVRSADCRVRVRPVLLVLAGVCLAVADAAQYMTALFAPVLLVIVATAIWRKHGAKVATMAALAVAAVWLTLIAIATHAAGHQYWVGITTSTLHRMPSTVAAAVIFHRAYVSMSLILVLASLGALLAIRRKERGRYLLAVLAAAALLVPVEQARLHTTLSLQKHVVFGAWFAAIAAGYAMARLSRVDPGRGWAAVMAIPIVASTLFGSLEQAGSLYSVWPNSSAVIQTLRSVVHTHPGMYLAEDFDVEAYYLQDEVPWQRWANTYHFIYGGAQPDGPSYSAAISSHYFSLVILNFGDTAAIDRHVVADMRRAGGYYVLGRAGRFTIWASADPARSTSGGEQHVVD